MHLNQNLATGTVTQSLTRIQSRLSRGNVVSIKRASHMNVTFVQELASGVELPWSCSFSRSEYSVSSGRWSGLAPTSANCQCHKRQFADFSLTCLHVSVSYSTDTGSCWVMSWMGLRTWSLIEGLAVGKTAEDFTKQAYHPSRQDGRVNLPV